MADFCLDLNMKFIFSFLLLFIRGASSVKSCTKLTSCSCQTEDRSIIDLTPLTSTTSKAKFSDVKASSGDLFSWNPCKDFTESPEGCKNVAACQIQSSTPPALYSLGNQNSAKFKISEKQSVQISYEDTEGPSITRTSYVELICDTNDEGTLTAEGESPPGSGKYYMKLTSKHCCPRSPDEPSSNSLSIGSILLISLLVIVIVYVIVGLSVNKYARKATGKEIIPNYELWTSFPGLIKDGVLFCLSRCKTTKSYDNI